MIGNVMLVTTCPECNTKFRISVGILEKAGGQVRCGRCAHIFDANTALNELDDNGSREEFSAEFKFHLSPDAAADLAKPDSLAADRKPDRDSYAGSDSDSDSDSDSGTEPEPEAEPEPESGAEPAPKSETNRSTAAKTGYRPGIATAPAPLPDWRPESEAIEPGRSWPWTLGAVLLVLVLAAQIGHRYRSSLVTVPLIGPAIGSLYARLGTEVTPRFDLEQYDLLDLTAVAEPAGAAEGWLLIETRVRNSGPTEQPYPHVFVRLLDRWQDTIAARYFSAEEYSVTPIGDSHAMDAGSTIDAQFIIMDPGPSATGFELELCVETAASFLCESDFGE